MGAGLIFIQVVLGLIVCILVMFNMNIELFLILFFFGFFIYLIVLVAMFGIVIEFFAKKEKNVYKQCVYIVILILYIYIPYYVILPSLSRPFP